MDDIENVKLISGIILDKINTETKRHTKPMLVALDGGSGSGKSSIAKILVEELRATLVATDDFYAAHISDEEWLKHSHIERAASAIDWKRLRTNVLLPLLSGLPAKWNSFDFDAGIRPDGTYGIRSDFVIYEPNNIIILEGAYSSRPELADLVNLKILIDVPVEIRHVRLISREEKEFLAKWHERWDEAEHYYFQHVRPKSDFDLVIDNK